MVDAMIHRIKQLSGQEIAQLAENYLSNYVTTIEELTNKKVTDTTAIFEQFSYQEAKKEVMKILQEIKTIQRLPVVNFAAGGIATPADAAIMMQLGNDGVFVGSGIFKSDNPKERARAIVEAVAHYDEPDIIAEVSKDLGDAMPGLEIETIPKEQRLQERGW
jgi:pyridoxal 5'-phosphate synthase pdxS subunit